MSVNNILDDFSGNKAESWTHLKVASIDADNISLNGLTPGPNQFLRSDMQSKPFWGSINLQNIPFGPHNTFLKTVNDVITWAPADAVVSVNPSAINPGLESQLLSTRLGVSQWVDRIRLSNIPPSATNGNVLTTVAGAPSWQPLPAISVTPSQITPGNAYQILTTNSAGNATLWSDFINPNQISTIALPDGYTLKISGGVATWQQNNVDLTQLNPGAEGQIIRTVGGVPSWRSQLLLSNIPAGSDNQLLRSTAGSANWSSLISLLNIPPGSNAQVLKTSGSNVIWDFISASNFLPGLEGQVLRTIAGVPTWVDNIGLANIPPSGTNGYVLTTVAGVASWQPNNVSSVNPNAITPGTNGQFLATISGLAQWSNQFNYANFPTGTSGQIIKNTAGVWGASNTINLDNIPPGANTQLLSVAGGTATWINQSALALPPASITPGANGTILRTLAGTAQWQPTILTSNLPAGTNAVTQSTYWDGTSWSIAKLPLSVSANSPSPNQVLTSNASNVPTWSNTLPIANVAPGTNGQIVTVAGGVSGWSNTINLNNIPPSGTNGQFLSTVAGTPQWANVTVAPGTSGQIYQMVGANPSWVSTIFLNNIPIGTNNQILTTFASGVMWRDPQVIPKSPPYLQGLVSSAFNFNVAGGVNVPFATSNTPNPSFFTFDGTFLTNVSGSGIIVKSEFVLNASSSNSEIDISLILALGATSTVQTKTNIPNTGLLLNTNTCVTQVSTFNMPNGYTLNIRTSRVSGTTNIASIINQSVWNVTALGFF